MLDQKLQSMLQPSLKRKRRDFLTPLAIGMVPVIVGAFFYIANVETIDDRQLGKLAILAAESLEESPAGIWMLMERYIGKSQENFSADDSLRAVKYLVTRIDASAMKKEKFSAARLDL